MVEIGVLGLQGDFERHRVTLKRLSQEATIVVSAEQVATLDGLVIPGGESTTIGKLMVQFGLLEAIRSRIVEGLSVFGTCAGMILLARRIQASTQPRLGVLDIEVSRNAYGRQVASFETALTVDFLPEPITGIFIRAPLITDVGPEVTVLARFEGTPVLVRERNLLASSFHPELTDETRIHGYFLSIVEEARRLRARGGSVSSALSAG